jgi:type IV pilus assembly protein PilO
MKNIDLKDIASLPLKIQLIVSGIVFVLIFYLGYLWDSSSLTKELVASQQEEQDLKIQIDTLLKVLALMNSDVAQLPTLENALKDWQKKLVKPSELPDVLNEILKIGTANQLQFDIFNPSPEIKEDAYVKVPIKTVVIGDYPHIATFISQVANMPWIIVINNLVITKGTNKLFEKKAAEQPGYENRLTAELTLDVYSLTEKQEHAK